MTVKYPIWINKIEGAAQTPEEMNGLVEVLQNHAETLSLHHIRILAAASGIYTDALTPSSEVPTDVGDKVFLVTIPGTYTNFGNVVLPENNFGFIFKNGNNFSIQSVEMPTIPINGKVEEVNTQAVSGGEVYKGINEFSNNINISKLFPTGSPSSNAYYTLDSAILKLTDSTAKFGLIVTYRTSALALESYQLTGVSAGGFSKYYFNPANYTKIYYKSDIDLLANDINITAMYGGRYTLADAASKVTSEFGKIGLKITFRTTSGSVNNIETYQLIDQIKGEYPAYYNNPANYIKLLNKNEITGFINEVNISYLFPTGGYSGDFRYTLDGAIAKIPEDLVKVGLKVIFRATNSVTETWILERNNLASFSSYHLNPENWTKEPDRFEVDKLVNDITKWNNEINISDIYGGVNYTLETAIAKLTHGIAKVGLSITFRSSPIITESYRLVSATTGGYASYYLNPANYTKIYYKSDIDLLANDINISSLYGGRYTLADAASKVTSEFGKRGLKITFRTTSGSVNDIETYQLISAIQGEYPAYYNNPANYIKLLNKNEITGFINEVNISYLFPTGGYSGDYRYTLDGAIAKIPEDLVKVGLKVTFRTDLGRTTQTWVLVKDTLGGYSSYHLNPENYTREVERFEFDELNNYYNANCNNRLASTLFEDNSTWNTKNPTKTITSESIFTGTNEFGNYRIPTSILTNAGTILASAELRPIDSLGDYGKFSIDLYRKTSSGVVTRNIVIPYNTNGLGHFMNPCFVIDRTGANSGVVGRIYLFAGSFQKEDVWTENSTAESDYIYIYSDDDGVTWSGINSVKTKWDLSKYKLAIPAPNNGIQLTNGTLAIPSFSNRGALALIKEVGGDWYFSNEIIVGGYGRIDECTIVERETNEIVIIGRNNGNYRAYPNNTEGLFVYNKTTNSFVKEVTTFETNRSNQTSVCRAVIGGETIYLKSFTDSNAIDRRNLTLWASLDLKVWIRIYRIYAPEGNGYSSINFYSDRLIVSHETSRNILMQELTNLIPLITDTINTNLKTNISVQDRMQLIINMIKGI
ncbi:glycoside hydrolase [Empedobacter falsenii]